MPDPRIRISRDGPIATVTFDRAEVRNAFDLAMWSALHVAMDALSAEERLRCVVLRGAGTAAFSAGADIHAFATERGTPEQEARYAAIFHAAMQAIRLCRHPVVAMITGHCLGGGAGIATMCDFRVGGEGIHFGITANRMGLWYPHAEIEPILALAGSGVLAEMLIEGRIFSGREAYEKGLLSRVVPDDDVEAEAMALAGRIAAGAPLAARFHKAAIRALRGSLPVSAEAQAEAAGFVQTEDFREAVRAFAERRPPRFVGR